MAGNLDNVTLKDVRLFGADLRGAKGLETVVATSADVGAEGKSTVLEGEALRTWLADAAKTVD